MIDLTPLDVRKKRGDFRKGMRGYETREVDTFLDMVAERLEELVRENLQFRERLQFLERQVQSQTEREEAVRDALVTAQGLRTDIQEQARREAEKLIEDARTEGRRMLAEAEAEVRIRVRAAERRADEALSVLGELERRRFRFLRTFRQLLEREMDVVEVEEARPALEDRTFELELDARHPTPESEGLSEETTSKGAALAETEGTAIDPQEESEGEEAVPIEALGPPSDLTGEPAETLLLYLDDVEEEEERG